jgi:hypothetical protein
MLCGRFTHSFAPACKKGRCQPKNTYSVTPHALNPPENSLPMQLKKSLTFCAAPVLSFWSYALSTAPYSPEAFAKLQAAGDAVTLHVRADWCPSCRAQDKALAMSR